jgi:hypothetical protein
MQHSLHPFAAEAQCSMEGAPLRLTGSPGLSPDKTTEGSQAELLAYAFLVRAGERALFELLCSLGQAQDPGQVRAGLGAAELIREMLSLWRENLTTSRSSVYGVADNAPQLLLPVHRR